MPMKMGWRWYGEGNDPVSLSDIKQIPGVTSIVWALHDKMPGEVWEIDEIQKVADQIHAYGFDMDVVESVNVHDDIKIGLPTRDKYIENYKQCIRNLSKFGVKVICYNFMPIFDWPGTDLFHPVGDGSTALFYEKAKIKDDYKSMAEYIMSFTEKYNMTFPGWEPERMAKLDELFKAYAPVTKEKLWENLKYFLEAIMPTCHECNIKMAIHQDDPPWDIFGLPRLLVDEPSIDRFLKMVDDPYNCLTLCSGSLNANPNNNVAEIVRKHCDRIAFAHIRNIHHFPNGDFSEAAHRDCCGETGIIEILRAYHDCGFEGYIRPDHGRQLWEEGPGVCRPGYGKYDRALGVQYMLGVWDLLDRLDEEKKEGLITMKLSEIKNGNLSAEWAEKGYELPKFDIEAVKAKTHAEPTWVHFGAGNIFRAFPAAVLNDALNSGKYDRGVIVAESFDYEIIDKAYRPYDNLSLLVCLKSTGEIEKKVVASVTESLKADPSFAEDWARLVEIFQNPSLQMISFTITEKGYGVAPADLERGLTPVLAMGKVTALLYERFKAGKLPLTVQSMDNCSHNGDKVKNAVHTYAAKWVEQGLVPAEFLVYVQDETKVTFPWSMIDKITPRPDAKVQKMLADDGFEDNYTIVTEKHTFTAPFVNAEETQYLCIEDNYTNGRPPLELGGVLYCDRETVDKIEKMKVCTCLNPLHTAMSIYGCMLGYDLISAEMADEDLRAFIQKIGYIEAMPVVVDPGVLNPYEFIGAVINRRLPNPFMPDAPQRIATDTSQKLAIRFGETIKAYEARGLDKSNLVLIPLVLAGYARYLKGIDDNGQPFEISPDPLLAELQAIVNPLEVKEGEQDFSCLKALYSRVDVFGVDLYAVGLGDQIEGMVKELYAGPGAVRKTLHKYTVAR